MINVLLYEQENGHSPFADWFAGLDRQAAAKVTIADERLRLGNFSNIKGVVRECKSTASIGGQDIGSISVATAISW